MQIANLFRAPLTEQGVGYRGVARADGFTYCMSGPNGACADAAFQISTTKPLKEGETVLIHCNSYADGYWTDVTRTFALGHVDSQASAVEEAISEARKAALSTIRPGVMASQVDEAARKVLEDRGFGFGAGGATGHEVGFQAINHQAMPILRPFSEEKLEPGMVFNVEPGVYIPGVLGYRHCDMVAVTEDGYRLLTDF